MSVAEFEEKEFEGPLNTQLGVGGPLWSPGQVLEHLVGFDVAVLTFNAVFWAAQGFATPPPGAVVVPAWWPWGITRLVIGIRHPPPFQLNVFLQHKRPEFLFSSTSAEWATWNASYYRFKIKLQQQSALDACAAALGQNGLVAYASPAFHKRDDLWNHVKHGTLVANTHFAPAQNLTGHICYTYLDATTPGVAHSEPSHVEPLTILNGSGNGEGTPKPPAGDGDGRRPLELLREARQAAHAAISASPTLVGSETLFIAAVGRAETIVRFSDEKSITSDAIHNFIYALMFSAMSGIQWLVLSATAASRGSRI